MEATKWKYKLFVTLTYANEHLPLVRVEHNKVWSDELNEELDEVRYHIECDRIKEYLQDDILKVDYFEPNKHYV